MLLDLSQLHGQPKHYERRFEPSAFDPPDDDYRVAAPVNVVLDVEKAGGDAFRVTGRVTTTLMLECGRCLEAFELPVDAAFELRYVPAPEATDGAEREITEDDLTTSFYREGSLDVIELLREQFQLDAADEAAVHRGVPRSLSRMRDEPEPHRVRLHAEVGRPEARSAEGAAEAREGELTDA